MISSVRGKLLCLALLVVLLVLCVCWALTAGPYNIEIGQTFRILAAKLTGIGDDKLEKLHSVIIWNVRSPRVLLALVAGIALSLSGAVYQACFRNPLVEPYILGVSAGAAFGAALGIMFPGVFRSVQLAAFLCALAAVSLTWTISKMRGQSPVILLIISGIIIGSLFTALVSLLKYIAPDAKLREITFWMMGGFYYASWADVALSAPVVICALIVVCALSWKLNVLSMGDDEARSLGVHPDLWRAVFIVITTLVSALCVSQAGIVAWVGLMAPHAARMIFGADNTWVVPAGSLLGAIFLLACDTLARTITTSEIPVGILTAILGAPFLLYLLRSKGRALYG